MSNYRDLKKDPERIFAIGDVHGCADELGMLLHFLEDELAIGDKDHVVFIGDYIDRGPDSKGVVDSLLAFQKNHGAYTTFLKGNHEDMLLDFLGFEGQNGGAYVSNGGAQCFESYGIDPYLPNVEICEALPQEHVDFYKALERYVVTPSHVFAHAGLNPIIPLENQENEDVFWIRDEFIHNIHYFERTVVFGHTPFEDILFHLPYKIGIDTGLVYGNALTCIEVLSGRTFQIGFGENGIYESTFQDKGADMNEFQKEKR